MTTAVQKVFNSKSDSEEHFILCTEFLRYRIRVLILRNNNFPLTGDVTNSELWEMAGESFPGSEADFHEETRCALSGKAQNYKFYLDEKTLKWEKNLWTRGSVKLFSETDIINFSDTILTTLEKFIQNQDNFSSLEEKNKKMHDENKFFKCRLEDMNKIKDINDILLAKFITTVNNKKRKIRELVREIERLKERYEPSAYQLPTDEEMSDDEKEIKTTCSPKPSTSGAFQERFDSSFDFSTTPEMESEEKEMFEALNVSRSSPKPSTSVEFDRLRIKEVTPSKSNNLEEKQDSLPPMRRRGSIMDEELEDIVNNVVNSVPDKVSCRSSVKARKCLPFEDSDEEIELRYDSLTQYSIDDDDMFS